MLEILVIACGIVAVLLAFARLSERYAAADRAAELEDRETIFGILNDDPGVRLRGRDVQRRRLVRSRCRTAFSLRKVSRL